MPEFQESENIISVVNTTVSSISIEWQPAITLPISPVTRYIITLYNGTGLQDIGVVEVTTSLSFTFSDLKASTSYQISIAAVNSLGTSKPTANFTVNTIPLGM